MSIAIRNLPVELKNVILSYLNYDELNDFRGVSKEWRVVVDSDIVWKEIANRAKVDCPSKNIRDYFCEKYVGSDRDLFCQIWKFLSVGECNKFICRYGGKSLTVENGMRKGLLSDKKIVHAIVPFNEERFSTDPVSSLIRFNNEFMWMERARYRGSSIKNGWTETHIVWNQPVFGCVELTMPSSDVGELNYYLKIEKKITDLCFRSFKQVANEQEKRHRNFVLKCLIAIAGIVFSYIYIPFFKTNQSSLT